MTQSNTPLWRELNGKRMNGYTFSDTELRSFVPEGWEFFRARDYGGKQIGIKYRKPYAEGETHWNEDGFEYKEIFVTSKNVAAEKYAALAVNNLASLAEALEASIAQSKRVLALYDSLHHQVYSTWASAENADFKDMVNINNQSETALASIS